MSNRNLRAAAAVRAAGFTLGVNLLAIAAAVQNGETVTVGDETWEVDTIGDESTIDAGNIAVDLSGGSTVAAQGTLTIAEPVTADDTMTIGATTYTFKAGATANAGEIGLGADEAATKLAIVAAINGTDGVNTANASVTAAAFSGDDSVLTAIVPGTVGNAIVSTETFTHVSNVFDAATLGTTTAGVDPTAAEAITAFAAALLASDKLDAYARASVGVIIVDRRGQASPLACTETLAGSGNAWQSAVTFAYGDTGGDLENSPVAVIQSRSPSAGEVTNGVMAFAFGQVPTSHLVQVRDTNGDLKVWDGAALLSGNTLVLDNSGSTDWAATDEVTVVVGFG